MPVMYEGEKIALAVLADKTYSFNLADNIGARIDFLDLEAVFVYGKLGKGWSTQAEADDELQFIYLNKGKAGCRINFVTIIYPIDDVNNPEPPGSTASG